MKGSRETFIGEMLVESGAISPQQLSEAHRALSDRGDSLVTWLSANKVLDETRIWKAVAEEMDLEFLETIAGRGVQPHQIGRVAGRGRGETSGVAES